jgi:hypothetical protein
LTAAGGNLFELVSERPIRPKHQRDSAGTEDAYHPGGIQSYPERSGLPDVGSFREHDERADVEAAGRA